MAANRSDLLSARSGSWQSEAKRWGFVALYSVLYVVAAGLSLHFAIHNTNVSPVWVSSGVGFGAYLLLGSRMLWGIWIAAFIANYLGFQRLGLTNPSNLLLPAMIACGNTMEAWLGEYIGRNLYALSLRLFPDELPVEEDASKFQYVGLSRLWMLCDARSVTVFVVSMFAACGCCAMVGSWAHWLFATMPTSHGFHEVVYTWWSGDLLGLILVAPAFVVFRTSTPADWRSIYSFQALLTYGVLLVSAVVCFGGYPDLVGQCLLACLVPVITVILPFVVPLNGVVVGNFIVAAAAIVGSYHGTGPLAWKEQVDSWLLLQTYIAVTSLIGFVVSALVSRSNLLAIRLAKMHAKETEEVYKQRLRESSQRLLETSADLQGVLGAFPDIYFWLDPDGTFRRYFSTVPTHIPPEKFLNRKIQDIMPASVSSMLVDALNRSTQTKAVVEVDYPLETNGRVGWFEARLQQLESGQILAIVRDITSRKMAETRLQELLLERQEVAQLHSQRAVELARSNAELEQFAYVASHDLREPLRMVRNFCSLLQEKYENVLDEKGVAYIGYAADGAKRMQFMVDDLLEYSRVGRGEYKFVNISLSSIIQQVMENLQASIEESRATIEYFDLPVIYVDVQRLTQLLQNLISNSIKFSGDCPPKIQILYTSTDTKWKFEVRDNGIGIESQYFEKVFLMFQRLHCHSKYHGTGVGLAICKRIVEQHGGEIWIESELGQGTSVFFTLPFTQPAGIFSQHNGIFTA